MIYEFRVYTVAPGKMEALKKRFETMSIPLFEKHGIKVIGFWEGGSIPSDAERIQTEDGIVVITKDTEFDGSELVYMVAFDNIEERDKAWKDFLIDPEWHRLRSESEATEGKMVLGEQTKMLRPTGFSPLK